MSEKRKGKWENLDYDCLVNILRRVGNVSLLLDVPFVCKSWHKASLDHSCWQHLDFNEFTYDRFLQYRFVGSYVIRDPDKRPELRFRKEYRVQNFSIRRFVRLLVARGSGKSTSLVLPASCNYKDLCHISEKCHELTSLSYELDCSFEEFGVPMLIGKWKLLEELTLSLRFIPMDGDSILLEIFYQIEQNCKKFYNLSFCSGTIEKEVAQAIANHLPKITRLRFECCLMEQENLEIIILGCKHLEYLVVYDCWFNGIWDDKKLKDMASHIKTLTLFAEEDIDHSGLDPEQNSDDSNSSGSDDSNSSGSDDYDL